MSTTMTVNESAATSSDERAGKYLTFQLSNEEFGIRVLKVREIMGLQEITAVPQTPAHIKGVINLRGKVVPVIDLRLKFGLAAADYTQRTCIIVTQVQAESGAVLMGIVVDGVSEVLTLAGSEIEDTPDFGEEYSGGYLLGMAKVKGKVKILLDIERVLSTQDLHNLNACCANAASRGIDLNEKKHSHLRRQDQLHVRRACGRARPNRLVRLLQRGIPVGFTRHSDRKNAPKDRACGATERRGS